MTNLPLDQRMFRWNEWVCTLAEDHSLYSKKDVLLQAIRLASRHKVQWNTLPVGRFQKLLALRTRSLWDRQQRKILGAEEVLQAVSESDASQSVAAVLIYVCIPDIVAIELLELNGQCIGAMYFDQINPRYLEQELNRRRGN